MQFVEEVEDEQVWQRGMMAEQERQVETDAKYPLELSHTHCPEERTKGKAQAKQVVEVQLEQGRAHEMHQVLSRR